MTEEQVMEVLEGLHEIYFKPVENNDPTAWPFK
jgi:hypothetical protein